MLAYGVVEMGYIRMSSGLRRRRCVAEGIEEERERILF